MANYDEPVLNTPPRETKVLKSNIGAQTNIASMVQLRKSQDFMYEVPKKY